MSKLNVDVEEIMKEIKQQASLIDDLETLDFEDISTVKKEWDMPKVNERIYFKWDSFWDELSNANKFCNVDFIIPIPKGNFFATVIRKIVVKLIRFYFKITVARQNDYNANSVRALNEMGNFVRVMDIAVNRQNEINNKLELDIQELNMRFNKECIKRLDVYERQNRYLRKELQDMKKQIDYLYETQKN